MARKQRSGDSSDVYFDTRIKAVLTQTSHNSMANLKEQLASVREVVPNFKKDDILLVLEHFGGDVPKTIQAFMEDGAEDILKEWNIPNKRKTGNNVNKKNKKKRSKQTVSQEDATVDPNGRQEEDIPNNNNIDKPIESKMEVVTSAKVDGGKLSTQQPQPASAATSQAKPRHQQDRQQSATTVDSPKQQRKPQQHPSNNSRNAQSQPRGHPGSNAQNKAQEPRERPAQAQSRSNNNPRQGPARAGQRQYSDKPASGPTPDSRTGKEDRSGQRSGQVVTPKQGQSSEGGGKRERNVSESSSATDPSRSKKAGSTLDKSSKDLQRTVVSLTRHKNLLEEEIEKAEKRLKKAFDDARTSLSTREEDLMRQIQETKRHATSLLDDRQHNAFALKQDISRAVSKSDHDLLELRADIKHFVSERKIDEEIGRSSRFTGNLDILQEAIKNFGEVLAIKNVYSARRQSLTSLTSLDNLSRPTSISDDHGGLLSRSASTLEGSVKNSLGSASMPATPTSPMAPDADVDSEVAEMAAKLQRSMQGQRGRGPWNPRQQADNPRQSRQGSNPRQGQFDKEGSRQDQRENRGRQNSQNRRVSDRPQREIAHPGRRNERPWSERGEGGFRKEEPRNKDRNIRRREQYRRRHVQGSDINPEGVADKDVKKGTGSVPHPNSIPVPQTGPSPASVDKKPAANDDIPAANTNSTEKPKPPAATSQSLKPQVARADSTEKPKPPAVSSQSLKPQVADADSAGKPEPRAQPEKTKAQVSDIPLVNGNASSSAGSSPTEALPQRKPREERNRRVKEVVKEVTSMNGMTNGEVPPVMVNGES